MGGRKDHSQLPSPIRQPRPRAQAASACGAGSGGRPARERESPREEEGFAWGGGGGGGGGGPPPQGRLGGGAALDGRVGADLSAADLWDRLEPELGYLPAEEVERLRRATDLAFRAHDGQRRKSGEPFVVHPVEVAAILAHLRMDADTVAAGLLHDTVEDTALTFGEIAAEFGPGVARIVEGETKVSKIGELASSPSKREVQALDLRSMFVAMTEDVRVIVVKLADRLHNMRTLGAMPPEKQRRIAKETLKVFAPLARVLGLYCIKEELEELGFRYSEPEASVALARRMDELSAQQEAVVLACQAALEEGLGGDPLLAAVAGGRIEIAARTRGHYPIHRKLQATGAQLGHLRDVAQLVVVIDAKDPSMGPSVCYQALGVVHSLWAPLPGRMKDFVATPKANGYQSLHTTVLPLGAGEPFPLEIHIRTAEMHRLAQFGYVAEMAASQQMSRRDPEGSGGSPALDPVLPGWADGGVVGGGNGGREGKREGINDGDACGPHHPANGNGNGNGAGNGNGNSAAASSDRDGGAAASSSSPSLRAPPSPPGGNANGNGNGIGGAKGAIGRGLSRGVVARQVHWLHSMRDWHHEFVANLSASEWVETVVGDLLRGGVFVFTPEGDFVNLPKGSTVIDFAYHIRSEVGNEMVMAKVNGIPVHPSYEVQNAEVVEIVRARAPPTPDTYLRHREWVQYAATRSARYRIQKFLLENENLDTTGSGAGSGFDLEEGSAGGDVVTGSMGGSIEEDLIVGDPYEHGETMWLIVKSDDRFGLLSEITRVISSHSLSIRSYSGSAGGGTGFAHMNYELSGPTSNLIAMCKEISETSGVTGYSIGCNWTPDTQGPFSRRM